LPNAIVWQDTAVVENVAGLHRMRTDRFARRPGCAQHLLQQPEVALAASKCPEGKRKPLRASYFSEIIDTFLLWN